MSIELIRDILLWVSIQTPLANYRNPGVLLASPFEKGGFI